jgi:hypothetical protein
MPKEITHWLVAEQAMRELEWERQNGDQAFVQQSLVRLGAVFPDAPYYTLGGKRPRALQLADRLHGALGEDTFDIVQDCIAVIRQTSHEDSFSQSFRDFLFGAITHICTDVIFHPFVYFWSGDVRTNFHCAWRNHRAFESALDLVFCKEFGVHPDSFSLAQDLHHCTPVLAGILAHVPSIVPFHKEILSGYSTMATVRRLGANAPLGWLLDRVESALPISWQFYTALRYTTDRGLDAKKMYKFQHPVTGELDFTSFQTLFDASVQESVRVWGQVERCLASGEAFEERGKSLEVGIAGIASSEMRYFVAFV